MKMLTNLKNRLRPQMNWWWWHCIAAVTFHFGTAATRADILATFQAVLPPTTTSTPTSMPPPSPSPPSSTPVEASPLSLLSPLLPPSSATLPLVSSYPTQFIRRSSPVALMTNRLVASTVTTSPLETVSVLESGSVPSPSMLYVMGEPPIAAASASALADLMATDDDDNDGRGRAHGGGGMAAAAALTDDTFLSPSAVTSAFIEPYLDGFASTNITAQIGTHAYLPCRVKQLGNKSVSWIRVRDGHILTVDRAVFIADQRFMALKQPNKFWTLQIKYVQARDAGAYECQVSTEPKVSARVHLHVVVPRTEILGDPDRYVKAGSTVILRCIVRGALEPPTFIMWYHGIDQLTADSKRHKITLERNLPEIEGDAHSTIGSLIIESAKKRDTGNYTCNPSNSPSVTVTLNVINGESSASAVTSSASMTRKFYSTYSHALIFSLIIIGGHKT